METNTKTNPTISAEQYLDPNADFNYCSNRRPGVYGLHQWQIWPDATTTYYVGAKCARCGIMATLRLVPASFLEGNVFDRIEPGSTYGTMIEWVSQK